MDKGYPHSIIPLVFAVLCVILLIFISATIFTHAKTCYETVDSKITNTNIILDDNGEIEFLEITFANNQTYKVKTYDDIDLTVSSRIIIEFRYMESRNCLWDDYEPCDDTYTINKVIKVPDNIEHISGYWCNETEE